MSSAPSPEGARAGFRQGEMDGGPEQQEFYQSDTAETVNISPLALLKMLKHGRAGVPLEVMGLMLGNFVDEYTIDVVRACVRVVHGRCVRACVRAR